MKISRDGTRSTQHTALQVDSVDTAAPRSCIRVFMKLLSRSSAKLREIVPLLVTGSKPEPPFALLTAVVRMASNPYSVSPVQPTSIYTQETLSCN